MKKILILFVATISTISFGQDIFTKREAPTLKIFDPVSITANIRDYPILPLGNQWLFALASTTYSTGTGSGIPLANLVLTNLDEKKILAILDMQANLEELSSVGDWTDEPCKRDDFL
jgi:hypothetical protein